MSAIGILSIIGLAMVAIPTTIALVNVRRLKRAAPAADCPDSEALVSCCIPARDEAGNLEACVRSLLDGGHQRIEVLVYDDESTDETPAILARLSEEDPRVRAVGTRPLPEGWKTARDGGRTSFGGGV